MNRLIQMILSIEPIETFFLKTLLLCPFILTYRYRFFAQHLELKAVPSCFMLVP